MVACLSLAKFHLASDSLAVTLINLVESAHGLHVTESLSFIFLRISCSPIESKLSMPMIGFVSVLTSHQLSFFFSPFISVSSLYLFLIVIGFPLTSANWLSDLFVTSLSGRTPLVYLAGSCYWTACVHHYHYFLPRWFLSRWTRFDSRPWQHLAWLFELLDCYLLPCGFLELHFLSVSSRSVFSTSGILATVSAPSDLLWPGISSCH